jgi:hypothetical protein
MKMITLLANKFPIALSLFSSSLPELVALAFVLAMAGTVNSASARKWQGIGLAPQQNLTLGGNVNFYTLNNDAILER